MAEEVVTTPTPAAAPVQTPAPAAEQLDPNTGLPVQTQKPDPLADPVVVAELQKLRGQISTLTKDSKSVKDQLAEAQGKLTEYENAQLTEAQKKEKEYQDAIAATAAANTAKAQVELENIKLKAFIGSGLKPEFLRFVQGSTEEEVKESISDLQKLIAESAPAPVAAPVQTPTVPPVTPQPTAPVTQPAAAPKRTFTQAEIAAMSPAEYAKNREAILQAAARNEIK